MSKFTFARLALGFLFFIVTILQVFSFPGQFAHMRRENGISLILELFLTVAVVGLFFCAQMAIFSLWKLINHMSDHTFFTEASLTWLNRFVTATRTALVFPIFMILIVAPQADDPGAMVMLSALTLFVGSFFLVSSLLRDQIRSKVAS